ncbi:MAG: flagellar basal body L-ring protein FlgH [Planctomycetota bacterium]|jgi:flagellar L-ring protein precursor FlgH
MSTSVRIGLVAAVLAVAAGAASAGSIWKRGTRRMKRITIDDAAREVGDVITITIRERSVIENDTSRKMDKTTSRKAGTSGTLDLANLIGQSVGKHIFDFPKLDLDFSSETKFDGNTDFGSDRSVEDKITVTVEDVLPNGNLVVFGKRQREVEGDTQIVQVSGIVRPGDIGFDNTVDSDRVANFRLVYKGQGQEPKFSKPGWVGRLLNRLNPF